MEEASVTYDKLQFRGQSIINGLLDDIAYFPNEDTPFTGKVEDFFENGQKKVELTFKDGKRDGLSTYWYENGQKESETNWKNGSPDGLWAKWSKNGQNEQETNCKDGKRDGLTTYWYENGQKKVERNFKDGKQDGLTTLWYENGQKREEGNFKDGKEDGPVTKWYRNGQKQEKGNWKDGKLMSAEAWKPNGEKCPVTNVNDGNGVWVLYNDDGTELVRRTYKDGYPVFD